MARKILLVVLLAATATACRAGEQEQAGRDREPIAAGVTDPRPVVLFLGTSLTAGYGLPSGEAYPALIQDKIDSAGFKYRVVNAGESGATSAGGVRRVAWLMRQPVDVLVLELGANDGLRGFDPSITKNNLGRIIDSARVLRPDIAVLLAAMEAPPNLGADYTSQFRRIFAELATERQVSLIPFLLDGVAGFPHLNQADGIHPTAEGQARVAENVWSELGKALRRLSRAQSAADQS